MSSYTITIMTWKPGGLIPKVINVRNTLVYMENILGGEISIIEKNAPIKGTMIIGGPWQKWGDGYCKKCSRSLGWTHKRRAEAGHGLVLAQPW